MITRSRSGAAAVSGRTAATANTAARISTQDRDDPRWADLAAWDSAMTRRQIGRAHVELQSLMRISYAVFCLKKKTNNTNKTLKTRPPRQTTEHNTRSPQ